MSRSAPRQMADLVGAGGEVGDLLARLDAAPHPLGGVGELAHRLGDGVGERQRQHQHHRRQHQEERAAAPSAPTAITVSMSPPCVESSSAPRIAPPARWIGTRDRNDRLVGGVDPHRRLGSAGERRGDLGHRLAVGRPFLGGAPLLRRREGLAQVAPCLSPPWRCLGARLGSAGRGRAADSVLESSSSRPSRS